MSKEYRTFEEFRISELDGHTPDEVDCAYYGWYARDTDLSAILGEFEALAGKWWIEAEGRCLYCRQNWELGRSGCHYEPIPANTPPEEYESITQNCQAFGIRKRHRELSALIQSVKERM